MNQLEPCTSVLQPNTQDTRAALLPAENCKQYCTPPKMALIEPYKSRHLQYLH